MLGAEEVNRWAFIGVILLFPSELMVELKLFAFDIEFVAYFGEIPEYITTPPPLPPLLVLIPLLPYKDYSIVSCSRSATSGSFRGLYNGCCISVSDGKRGIYLN